MRNSAARVAGIAIADDLDRAIVERAKSEVVPWRVYRHSALPIWTTNFI